MLHSQIARQQKTPDLCFAQSVIRRDCAKVPNHCGRPAPVHSVPGQADRTIKTSASKDGCDSFRGYFPPGAMGPHQTTSSLSVESGLVRRRCLGAQQSSEAGKFPGFRSTDTRYKATIDLMRQVDDAPSGVMDFLFTELILHFKEDGYREFSPGNAPLSGLDARRGAKLGTRLGAFVYRHGRQFCNFEGLRNFKENSTPTGDPSTSRWHRARISSAWRRTWFR